MSELGIFRRILTFLIICNVYFISAQMPKKSYSPMKSDIPFIKCDVCKKGLKHVYRKTQDLRIESPKRKIDEEKLQELVEKSCNPDKFEGEWLAKLDIEERNNELVLVEQKGLGSCKVECRTIAKACQETVGEADVDIAEELWKDELSLSKLINQVCYTDTKACAKNTAKLKQGTRKDEKFQVMSDDEKKAQEYMKKASDMPGMPNMQMYSRDEMEEMVKEKSKKDSSGDQSEQETYSHGQGSIIWQTIIQVFQDIWAWIKNMLGWKAINRADL